MKKLITIDSCDMCPFFDNEYYDYNHTCTKTGKVVEQETIDYRYVHHIPTDCPLEDSEN